MPIDDTVESSQEELASIFEERAEHLSEDELLRWTTFTTKDEELVTKLRGPGAKLLLGPRGSGKSTLLKTAYFRALQDRDVLPVYVNYSRSMALEPLFHKTANALHLFRQWLGMKLVLGVSETFTQLKAVQPPELASLAPTAKLVVQQLESGLLPDSLERTVSPSQLVEYLESWGESLGIRRCVLLLDDAAHAFSPEQQRDFFEVFRELRSRRIAPKAAVYPGVTSYSPHFHVGHEAEVLEAWYRPDEDDYLATMRQIVAKRLPPALQEALADKQEMVDLLALASFGMPRGFLNMLSELLSVGEDGNPAPTRQRAERAVAHYAETARGVFRALASKLPRFKNFIELGGDLEDALLKALRVYNKLQSTPKSKATTVAIQEPLGPPLDRMLNMLEYAGLIRKSGTVSRGVKGRFVRYMVNSACVIADNSLSLGKSYPLSSVTAALLSKNAHAFVRTKGTALLGDDFERRCSLDLPPCPKCQAARQTEDQRFCMKCGAELADVSVYEELLRTPVEKLPLTQKKIDGILEHTSIRTVQDLLLDDERQHLRRVPYIGPFWAMRIRTVAEEFVGV